MAFKECFTKQMESLGLPAPITIFGSVTVATATIGTLAKAVSTYGTQVTLREIIGATFVGESAAATAAALSEVVVVAGAITASFYLGACIGSLISCTIDSAIAIKYSVLTNGLPFENAAVLLGAKHIALPGNMRRMMQENPEFLGAQPGDDYDVRMARVGFGTASGTGIA